LKERKTSGKKREESLLNRWILLSIRPAIDGKGGGKKMEGEEKGKEWSGLFSQNCD